MKKVLILCNSNPNIDPRPNRMVHYLKDKYEVTVVGQNEVSIIGIESIGLYYSSLAKTIQKILFAGTQKQMRTNPANYFLVMTGRTLVKWLLRFLYLLKGGLKKLVRIARLLLKQYEAIVWSELGHARKIQKILVGKDFDLIISHDLVLLPLAFAIKNESTRVILDAREFYPKNFDDQWRWRLEVKPVNEYLCRQYLPHCDQVITVSNGLAREYENEYNIKPDVIMSLPTFRDLAPSTVDQNQIRMIYHGYGSYSRRTEVMIEMMDYVDDRFSLDLMLLVTGDSYYRKVVSMAKSRNNVRVLPPVAMHDIVSTTNKYDIGLYLLPPTNLNIEYALPNKLFEFIQARLAVVIGPSIEMRKIVKKYNCGIVSKDFKSISLAQELNHLTPERLIQLKANSHKAAQELNSETNRKIILEIVQDLIDKKSSF